MLNFSEERLKGFPGVSFFQTVAILSTSQEH